jgi:hypothetical protein
MHTQHFSAMTRVTSRAKLALLVRLLISVFLLAQYAGFSHRIAHATQFGAQARSAISPKYSDVNSQHSCLLFDAISLAAGLLTNATSLAPAHLDYNLSLSLTLLVWLAQPQIYFSSRAPPQEMPYSP